MNEAVTKLKLPRYVVCLVCKLPFPKDSNDSKVIIQDFKDFTGRQVSDSANHQMRTKHNEFVEIGLTESSEILRWKSFKMTKELLEQEAERTMKQYNKETGNCDTCYSNPCVCDMATVGERE